MPRTTLGLSSFSARTRALWISAFLLLIWIQMFISLLIFGGVFVCSDKTAIDRFHFRRAHQDNGLSCDDWSPVNGEGSAMKYYTAQTVVQLFLNAAVGLVPFALLSMLFAAYTKDRATHRWSMACLATSSLLNLTGIIGFLILYWSYVNRERMTPGFYICLGVQVQLAIATVLTHGSGKKLTSDWN